MAKGKSLNPADAYRKALRKKELKKNKTERSKAREFALVKKDTRDMEDEIEKLETVTDPSAANKSRLTELKAEMAKVMAKKEEYVKEHPEHRKLVYRARRDQGNDQPPAPSGEQKRNLFDKRGLPRHPQRSIYYDPVLNPYGVPPPGMPYIEKPLREDEIVSEDEGLDDTDDDIVMPEGPPPGNDLGKDDSDSDDDIPMPEGPPPNIAQTENFVPAPISSGSISATHFPTSLVPLPPTLFAPPFAPSFVPPPPPPHSFRGNVYLPYSHGHYGTLPSFPPPPAGTIQSIAPPPGFLPQLVVSAQTSSSFIPSNKHQLPHSDRPVLGHPSLPPKPPTTSGSTSVSVLHPSSSATISAAPELRDLKKEATAFVPPSLKRKKASALPARPRVNAAPSVEGSESRESPAVRPDLVSALRDQFGAPPPPPPTETGSSEGPASKNKDDYQKFLEEMGDILGTSRP
ncbi:WW domain binding protein 11-domain-containing protein [Scleroderma citrinum]